MFVVPISSRSFGGCPLMSTDRCQQQFGSLGRTLRALEELQQLASADSSKTLTEDCLPINDATKFGVQLDVAEFKPEDLKVQVIGDRLVISGKHEERQDGQSFVSRQFTRSFLLPGDVDLAKMKSSLTTDHRLTIEAPKKQPEPLKITIEQAKDASEKKE